uniref:Secologanin synthase n=1 Tax=Aegilops tauschii TaxID=37682 RepID=M8BGY1_AEGTA
MASFAALPLAALLVLAVSWAWEHLVWRPYAIAKRHRAQGIHGPPYRFLKGSNEEVRRMKAETADVVLDVRDHNYLPRVAPHFLKWRAQYGEPFLFWFGANPRICVFDYEMVRQILSSKSGHFPKNDAHPNVLELLGKGLVLVNGVDWVRHRRVIDPAFAMDKMKAMTKTMVSCAQCTFGVFEEQAAKNTNGEILVEFDKAVQGLTADIISHTAFGSSYKLGMEAFHAQKELQAIAISSLLNVQIPGFSYLPTRRNRLKWMLEKKLRSTLMCIINSRLASRGSGYGNDLLGLMLEACTTTEQGGKQEQLSLSMDEILHECKTFFFAGYETTSILLTWTVFLLSVYPEWQERLREEMTMVLHEALRLYGPALFMQRKTITDMVVGAITIPKDHAVVIGAPFMHRDKKVWGEDADQFNPTRFANGVARAAKVPHALLAFSIGPRACIGQNFAMLEAKSVMATVLQKFSFTLSPTYVHAPADFLTLQPKFGLPVVMKLLDV